MTNSYAGWFYSSGEDREDGLFWTVRNWALEFGNIGIFAELGNTS